MIGESRKDLHDEKIISDLPIRIHIREYKAIDIEDEKKPRGRPKTITSTKEEYQKNYYQQRYSQKKDEIKVNCAKNSKKYRDSYKILLEIYEKGKVNEEILSRIQNIIE